MTRRFLSPALPFALLLAACSGGSDDGDQADASDAMPVEADGGIGDGAVPPQPVRSDTIPAAFVGVWDHAKGACDPNSEARMEIGPKTVGFYESHGEVTGVEVDSPEQIVVSLAMEGEGETWQNATMYTLGADGKQLTTSSVNGEQYEPLTLKKCE